ncbi:MAG: hypothetical protein J5806_10610 [Lentisphaeria bacterium]|nr:hypothetical protein [Lentisphaeria bacterium]
MNVNWIEEIKRNDEMTILDRYFPGKSCGNTECEQHCIELCKIAERMGGMKKNEIASSVARLLVYPENCPALKSGRDHESCRFLLFSHDRISAYDDRTGRRIIGKKYISDADASKSGACKLPYWIWGNTEDDPTSLLKRTTGSNNLNELWENWVVKKIMN